MAKKVFKVTDTLREKYQDKFNNQARVLEFKNKTVYYIPHVHKNAGLRHEDLDVLFDRYVEYMEKKAA